MPYRNHAISLSKLKVQCLATMKHQFYELMYVPVHEHKLYSECAIYDKWQPKKYYFVFVLIRATGWPCSKGGFVFCVC